MPDIRLALMISTELLKISWWPLPFRYLAKIVTTADGKKPKHTAFHTQL